MNIAHPCSETLLIILSAWFVRTPFNNLLSGLACFTLYLVLTATRWDGVISVTYRSHPRILM